MRIFYELSFEKIKEFVFKHAPYQKVAIFYDSSTDLEVMEKIIMDIKNDTIITECNLETINNIKKVFNDDVRVVITILNDSNFSKLKNVISKFVKVINLYEGNFPSFQVIENDGLLFLLNKNFDYSTEFLLQANYLVQSKFYDILSYRNYGQADSCLDREIELLQNCKDIKSVNFLSNNFYQANREYSEYLNSDNLVDPKIILYVSLISFKFLFLSTKNNNYILTDIYKDYLNDFENLNVAYEILNNERINYVLKNYADTMLEMIEKILKNINKLNLKTNLNLNKILKLIKNQCKINKKDNLLKISYLYGVFNAI